MTGLPLGDIGVVLIGRNEGERLRRCLASVCGNAAHVVYVDSGSTDGSVSLARSLGAMAVELDLATPFTAARARNAGLERLLQAAPALPFVQFVDGDCEVDPGWLGTARAALESRPDLAVVCGRRRERFPERSLYNRLCDIEWNTPVGETTYCGGDAMMRVQALQQVGGYRAALIAGEEPELCFRLRETGWKILRLDAEMTLHDAEMTRFRQWWKRAFRAGHAYAEGSWLHGRSPERYWVHDTLSFFFWGPALPVVILVAAWPTCGFSLILAAGYPVLGARIYRHMRKRGFPPSDSALFALFCVLAKAPQMLGALKFYRSRLRGKANPLIEYK